jgi:hypothetical protein
MKKKMSEELKQCPSNPAAKCNMQYPCEGCEDFRPIYVEKMQILKCLKDVLEQACFINGRFDSLALTAYADGIVMLSKYGMADIEIHAGRRVITKAKT